MRDHRRKMRIELTKDVERLAPAVEGYLAQRLERNVLATVLAGLWRGRFDATRALLAACFDEHGHLQAVALRTPPRAMLATGFTAQSARLLMERWLAEDPLLPGVSAEPEPAHAILAAWTSLTGGRSRCSMREALHELTEVKGPSRPASGWLRVAAEQERELLVEWEKAFAVEAGTGVAEQAERSVITRLEAGAQRVWDDGGPVCALALAPPVEGTVRIGPVYTPPCHRGHGYAGSAVAAACRETLDGGARRCMLFTDLANPTSNKIYADVGFRAFAEWEEHRFELP